MADYGLSAQTVTFTVTESYTPPAPPVIEKTLLWSNLSSSMYLDMMRAGTYSLSWGFNFGTGIATFDWTVRNLASFPKPTTSQGTSIESYTQTHLIIWSSQPTQIRSRNASGGSIIFQPGRTIPAYTLALAWQIQNFSTVTRFVPLVYETQWIRYADNIDQFRGYSDGRLQVRSSVNGTYSTAP